jgi:hypothetical protein
MDRLHQLMQQQLLLPLHTVGSNPAAVLAATAAAAAAVGVAAADRAARRCACLQLLC